MLDFKQVYKIIKNKEIKSKVIFQDLSIKKIYNEHAKLINKIGSSLMQEEGKTFIIDDNNQKVLKFLLYYFNECELIKDLYPEEKYNLNNQIMLCGIVGAGKTIIMKIFSEYLKYTKNPKYYSCTSITKMINYYKINNHLDKFTYNEIESNKFEGNPTSLCMNDIGLDTYKYFGTDFKMLIDEFLYARNEILINSKRTTHLTTNLTAREIQKMFDERLIDRFKTYNIIDLTGKSRR